MVARTLSGVEQLLTKSTSRLYKSIRHCVKHATLHTRLLILTSRRLARARAAARRGRGVVLPPGKHAWPHGMVSTAILQTCEYNTYRGARSVSRFTAPLVSMAPPRQSTRSMHSLPRPVHVGRRAALCRRRAGRAGAPK